MIDTQKLQEGWGYDTAWPLAGSVQFQNIGGSATPGIYKTTVQHKPTEYGTQTTTTQAAPASGGTMQDIQYPSEWNQAGDVWSKLAGGNYSNAGTDYWQKMMATGGSPVDVNAWGAAQKPAMMDQFSNMVKQMAEQAGVGGTRYGSGLQNSIANYGGQLMNSFEQQLANNWLAAQESGMGRAANSANQYAPLSLGAMTTGASGLQGLGSEKNALSLNLANQLAGLGGALTNQQIDPWTQMMASLVGNPAMTQQTYQPNTMTNLLGILGGMPWGDIFGSGNNNDWIKSFSLAGK